jgi:hypothetical protein
MKHEQKSGFQSRESNRPPIPLMPGLRQLAREKADPPFRVWAAIAPPWCSPGGVLFRQSYGVARASIDAVTAKRLGKR